MQTKTVSSEQWQQLKSMLSVERTQNAQLLQELKNLQNFLEQHPQKSESSICKSSTSSVGYFPELDYLNDSDNNADSYGNPNPDYYPGQGIGCDNILRVEPEENGLKQRNSSFLFPHREFQVLRAVNQQPLSPRDSPNPKARLSFVFRDREVKKQICSICRRQMQLQSEISPKLLGLKQIKQQWKLWSQKIESTLKNKIQLSKINSLQKNLQHLPIYDNDSPFADESSHSHRKRRPSFFVRSSESFFRQNEVKSIFPDKEEKPKINLIQDICLFGPDQNDISESGHRKFHAKPQLFYPSHDNYKMYGNYFYPDQLIVRRTSRIKAAELVNRAIFCKNRKRSDCNVFIFRGQEGHPVTDINNGEVSTQLKDFVNKCNPSRWLYGITIDFEDFISFQQIEKGGQIQDSLNKTKNEQQPKFYKRSSLIQDQCKGSQVLFKANFCLCILTYFPFVAFLSDLLIKIIGTIKIQRIKQYNSDPSQKYTTIDINFFIDKFSQITQAIKQAVVASPIQKLLTAQQVLVLPVGDRIYKLTGLQKPETVLGLLNSEWAFRVFKLFDKEQLYQMYCYLLLEQLICFVCSDKYILTMTMLAFLSTFTKPFGYPHPCVSIVFDEELLQTPFTAILGLNKGSEWVSSNMDFLYRHKENLVICDLNGDEVKIRTKKKIKFYKSEKLRKIFNNLYKRIDAGINFFRKNNLPELLNRQVTQQENRAVNSFLYEIDCYYENEILSSLPNLEIISNMIEEQKEKGSGNQSVVYSRVISEIEKYFHQMRRKKKEKDSFCDILTQRQIFYVYLADKYSLK